MNIQHNYTQLLETTQNIYEKYLTKLKQNLIKFALVENPQKTIGKGTCYTDSLQEKMNTFIKKQTRKRQERKGETVK